MQEDIYEEANNVEPGKEQVDQSIIYSFKQQYESILVLVCTVTVSCKKGALHVHVDVQIVCEEMVAILILMLFSFDFYQCLSAFKKELLVTPLQLQFHKYDKYSQKCRELALENCERSKRSLQWPAGMINEQPTACQKDVDHLEKFNKDLKKQIQSSQKCHPTDSGLPYKMCVNPNSANQVVCKLEKTFSSKYMPCFRNDAPHESVEVIQSTIFFQSSPLTDKKYGLFAVDKLGTCGRAVCNQSKTNLVKKSGFNISSVSCRSLDLCHQITTRPSHTPLSLIGSDHPLVMHMIPVSQFSFQVETLFFSEEYSDCIVMVAVMVTAMFRHHGKTVIFQYMELSPHPRKPFNEAETEIAKGIFFKSDSSKCFKNVYTQLLVYRQMLSFLCLVANGKPLRPTHPRIDGPQQLVVPAEKQMVSIQYRGHPENNANYRCSKSKSQALSQDIICAQSTFIRPPVIPKTKTDPTKCQKSPKSRAQPRECKGSGGQRRCGTKRSGSTRSKRGTARMRQGNCSGSSSDFGNSGSDDREDDDGRDRDYKKQSPASFFLSFDQEEEIVKTSPPRKKHSKSKIPRSTLKSRKRKGLAHTSACKANVTFADIIAKRDVSHTDVTNTKFKAPKTEEAGPDSTFAMVYLPGPGPPTIQNHDSGLVGLPQLALTPFEARSEMVLQKGLSVAKDFFDKSFTSTTNFQPLPLPYALKETGFHPVYVPSKKVTYISSTQSYSSPFKQPKQVKVEQDKPLDISASFYLPSSPFKALGCLVEIPY